MNKRSIAFLGLVTWINLCFLIIWCGGFLIYLAILQKLPEVKDLAWDAVQNANSYDELLAISKATLRHDFAARETLKNLLLILFSVGIFHSVLTFLSLWIFKIRHRQ